MSFPLCDLCQGYLVNWDVQKTVWDYVFSKEVFNVNHASTTLVVTEPFFNFSSIQEAMSEIFFEEYEVDALLRINGEILENKVLFSYPKFNFTSIEIY